MEELGVYVGNLHADCTDTELERLFEKCGPISEVKVRSNRMRGTTFGFVTFKDARDTRAAIQDMDGYRHGGNELIVKLNQGSSKSMDSGNPDCRVYVGNLPRHAKDDDVRELFEKFGTIKSCAVRSNPSRGTTFGFVEFSDPRDAQDAIKDCDGVDFQGTRISVQALKPPRDPADIARDRDRFSYGRGRGGYGGGGYRGGYGGGGGYGGYRDRGPPGGYRGDPYKDEFGRDRDYGRRRSPSPDYRRRRSPSPYGRRRSPSPYRRRYSRSPSPYAKRQRRRSYSRSYSR
eukprot:TRINITY_DN75284_c0_g1_i1.p1 TRINITY_DN75284_c0_g1~~TRINITY_DN75284_c0_g1_i1.p1  ORF type:complete len:288 (+),score=-7.61 TRINITY_DN75284_c0_g1_i1:30-893(+)